MKNIGSIFAVTEEDGRRRFFWCVGKDSSQLNSDLIVVFREVYPASATPDFDEVVAGDVEFYCHVFLRVGTKLGYWSRVALRPVRRVFSMVFRDTNDYGNPSSRLSERWYVWQPNEPFQVVGRLTGEMRMAEPGVVFPPDSVVARIRTGRYGIQYPTYDAAVEARI